MPRLSLRAVLLATLLSLLASTDRGVARNSDVLAGFVYESAAPLSSTAKPLFDLQHPPPVRSWAVRYRGAGGDAVPGIFTLPAGKSKAPCILLLHGMGGNKQQMFLFFGLLAQRGYASLAIDIAGHGDRPKIGGKKVEDLDIVEMREMLARTVVDLRRGVDYLQTRPEIDVRRLGFVGISLGGMIGGVFAANEPRIKGAALLAAGGDWGKLLATSQHPFAKKVRARGAIDPVQIEATLADVDPAATIGKMAGRPVMLLNGDKDDIVPAACTEALFAAAREPRTRITLPGGHVPDLATLASRTFAWLDINVRK